MEGERGGVITPQAGSHEKIRREALENPYGGSDERVNLSNKKEEKKRKVLSLYFPLHFLFHYIYHFESKHRLSPLLT
jgi:hypothetical protein